ncbi:hypothetical protein RJT34_03491 [Clitoria ternatea]|uniref:Uncharacterized protein n=1 Tax=Clitoria ternatea TaxID=43366 RepID=A0AAN9Q2K6_CLITE
MVFEGQTCNLYNLHHTLHTQRLSISSSLQYPFTPNLYVIHLLIFSLSSNLLLFILASHSIEEREREIARERERESSGFAENPSEFKEPPLFQPGLSCCSGRLFFVFAFTVAQPTTTTQKKSFFCSISFCGCVLSLSFSRDWCVRR